MAVELFEHFLRTEVSRHPSLGTALQVKSNLRRCSKQFERTVAELHYRLIKAAVQQLFSRVSTTRLQELSSEASSSCETKYVITDSSQVGTPNSQSPRNEQPSARWDAQSNNSQGLHKQPPARSSPPRRRGNNADFGVGVQQRQTQNSGSYSWNRPQDARRQPGQAYPPLQHLECQQPQQQSGCQQLQQQPGCQQPQQQLGCQQLQQQPGCQQPQQQLGCQQLQQQPGCQQPRNRKPVSTQPHMSCRYPTNQKTQLPPRPQQAIREGPTYSYPKMNNPNRMAMAGWYVANMDALLSNLMRLFELIYRDTLQMCGVTQCDLRQLRNALPDPTLLSMQQRATGAWRPNFMNCKIDFLLHLAAMVYRNTQDIKCGCQCSLPADPCLGQNQQPTAPPQVQLQPSSHAGAPTQVQLQPSSHAGAPPQVQLQPSSHAGNAGNRWLPRRQPGSNRNNAAAVVTAASCCATCNSCRAPLTIPEMVTSLSPPPYCENLTPPQVTSLEALETVACHRCRSRQRCRHYSSSRSRHRSPSRSNSSASSKAASSNGNNRSGSCRRGRGRSRRLAARPSGDGICGFGGSDKRQEFAELLVSRAEVASDDESSDTETGRTCLSVDIKMPQ